ncbi:hypothetical protein DFH08DRAFT_947913 [Mycena albidolilacea]|uniref:Uncharacterized protein n=1 Tax=Mycena albidolilacea TaxID=1033008 RepID=A0AAD7AVY7_9AGAR|nr:hypothetical protein DFH08DRAFT_947913 [Mycena albidolilacea]
MSPVRIAAMNGVKMSAGKGKRCMSSSEGSLFPGKNDVLPAGCLHSLRVWLRANGVGHRLFGEDDLWLGADPDFGTVENAWFACLRPGDTTALGIPDAQVYDAVVGRARVQLLFGGLSATGIIDTRWRTPHLRVEGDPGRVAFLVYTVPVRSVPAGASHCLRVWLKTRRDDPSAHALDDSYMYQPVRRSDAFKIGARLDLGRWARGLLWGPPRARRKRSDLQIPSLVLYHELFGGVGKAKDSAEVDEVDKDADEEVSTENVGRVAGALDDVPDDDIIIPDETSTNPTREGVPAELGEEVAAAVRTRISLHFGRAAKVFKLEEIFDMRRLEEKSPWSGSLMPYALDGKRTLDDLLVEFEEDAPGAPDEAVPLPSDTQPKSQARPRASRRSRPNAIVRCLPAASTRRSACRRRIHPPRLFRWRSILLSTQSAINVRRADLGLSTLSRCVRRVDSDTQLKTQARSCTPVGFQADRTRHDPPSPTTDSADEKW